MEEEHVVTPKLILKPIKAKPKNLSKLIEETKEIKKIELKDEQLFRDFTYFEIEQRMKWLDKVMMP